MNINIIKNLKLKISHVEIGQVFYQIRILRKTCSMKIVSKKSGLFYYLMKKLSLLFIFSKIMNYTFIFLSEENRYSLFWSGKPRSENNLVEYTKDNLNKTQVISPYIKKPDFYPIETKICSKKEDKEKTFEKTIVSKTKPEFDNIDIDQGKKMSNKNEFFLEILNRFIIEGKLKNIKGVNLRVLFFNFFSEVLVLDLKLSKNDLTKICFCNPHYSTYNDSLSKTNLHQNWNFYWDNIYPLLL